MTPASLSMSSWRLINITFLGAKPPQTSAFAWHYPWTKLKAESNKWCRFHIVETDSKTILKLVQGLPHLILHLVVQWGVHIRDAHGRPFLSPCPSVLFSHWVCPSVSLHFLNRKSVCPSQGTQKLQNSAISGRKSMRPQKTTFGVHISLKPILQCNKMKAMQYVTCIKL